MPQIAHRKTAEVVSFLLLTQGNEQQRQQHLECLEEDWVGAMEASQATAGGNRIEAYRDMQKVEKVFDCLNRAALKKIRLEDLNKFISKNLRFQEFTAPLLFRSLSLLFSEASEILQSSCQQHLMIAQPFQLHITVKRRPESEK